MTVLGIGAQGRRGRPQIMMEVGGKMLNLFIDTGSEVTLVRKSALEGVTSIKAHKKRNIELTGVAGKVLPTSGEFDIKFQISDEKSCVHR